MRLYDFPYRHRDYTLPLLEKYVLFNIYDFTPNWVIELQTNPKDFAKNVLLVYVN